MTDYRFDQSPFEEINLEQMTSIEISRVRITKDNPTRDCGNKLARQIETKLGLSSGALDQFGLHLPDHIKDLAETVTQANISAEDAALVRSLLKRLHRC